MKDHLSWETLNDLVDGRLTGAERSAATAHVSACAECEASLAELQQTLGQASALARSIDPPAELWADVRATIEAGKVAHLATASPVRGGKGWWVTPGRIAVAAAVLVVVSSATTAAWLRSRETGGAVTAVGALPVAISWQVTERGYQTSVLELRRQLEEQREKLAPATVAAIERSLATIDLAIAEAREALLRDPVNAALSELLASNYRQKIELLRRATQLTSSS